MKWTLVAAIFVASATHAANGQSVRGSKHDLSVYGPGPIKAESETQACIFCHVSHSASKTAKHLSSRPEIGAGHVPYGSSTARQAAGTPTGASRVCLSCHDGTIAVGETIRKRIVMNAAAPGGKIPAGRRSNLGTDLRKTHPVSIAGKSPRTPKLRSPRGSAVRLDDGGEVQCTSCHDAHAEFGGAPEGMFLRETTRNSQLCTVCHERETGDHAASSRPFGPAQGNEMGFRSVGEAGCLACHRSHGADSRGRLLSRSETEDDDQICLRCHSGDAARQNIQRQVSKPYAHAMQARSGGKHDAAESPDDPGRRLPETSASASRHVVCVDCHDPHAATDQPAVAPAAGGPLAGVWGIDQSGNRVAPAAREYEVCFKCHGDSANKDRPPRLDAARRAAADDNLRRVFDPSAPSSHPVTAPGRNPDVPSLRAPFTTASYVYCGDCHGADDSPAMGGSGARGPHGSIYPYLLERNYTTGSRAVESPSTYALCYKCHDRDVVLSSRSAFPLHSLHVVGRQTPCSVCHAAHGVSGLRGTASGNAHLIDFDLNVVRPAPGTLEPYRSNGPRSGSCSLTCHGSKHDAAAY